jgi:D-glycero-alpha-D-manno-heptose-7-phosphate kinase
VLIARAPFRISLAGGGTDLPAYYERFGGQVISTTIDKFVYVVLNVDHGTDLQITSSDYGTFYRHAGHQPLEWVGDLTLPRAVFHEFDIHSGVRAFLASEVPPGTGLGSSSAVAVALIKSVSTACGQRLSPPEIAELACDIEIRKLGNPIGKQDQYAAAFGGLNAVAFSKDGVQVTPLRLDERTQTKLEQRLLLFYTGAARDSATILREQTKSSRGEDPRVLDALHSVKAVAFEMIRALKAGDVGLVGELLHASWEQKKRFAKGVSGPFIDECYAIARRSGAVGGKLTGAGGGGFLLLYCLPENQNAVTASLEPRGLRRMSFAFSRAGARVLMNASLRLPGSLSHVYACSL